MKVKKFFKWMIKSFLFGFISLFVFNYFGSYINLHIPVNIITILIISILRLPGLAGIVIYLII